MQATSLVIKRPVRVEGTVNYKLICGPKISRESIHEWVVKALNASKSLMALVMLNCCRKDGGLRLALCANLVLGSVTFTLPHLVPDETWEAAGEGTAMVLIVEFTDHNSRAPILRDRVCDYAPHLAWMARRRDCRLRLARLSRQATAVQRGKAHLPAPAAFVHQSGVSHHIGHRPTMEDSAMLCDDLDEGGQWGALTRQRTMPRTACYAVFDGHAGAEAGEYAAAHLHEHLRRSSLYHRDLRGALQAAFAQTEEDWLAHASRSNIEAGCTACVVAIRSGVAVVGHLGDARAVLGRRGGTATALTRDHTLKDGAEVSRVEAEGGVVRDGRIHDILQVPRAFGDYDIDHGRKLPGVSALPSIGEYRLREGDEMLILACDGIWDVLTSQQAVTLVRSHLLRGFSPTECADMLVGEALRRGSEDNCSAIVITLSNQPLVAGVGHVKSLALRPSLRSWTRSNAESGSTTCKTKRAPSPIVSRRLSDDSRPDDSTLLSRPTPQTDPPARWQAARKAWASPENAQPDIPRGRPFRHGRARSLDELMEEWGDLPCS
jgi:protein phosphatase 2C family protein 2/3